MSGLTTGAKVADVPGLEGRWSVWSKAADCPGAYFLVPIDEKAQALRVKYAVIRALNLASEVRGPVLELVRTDPARPDLLEAAERIAKDRRQNRSTTR